jgi:hypothetical protein
VQVQVAQDVQGLSMGGYAVQGLEQTVRVKDKPTRGDRTTRCVWPCRQFEESLGGSTTTATGLGRAGLWHEGVRRARSRTTVRVEDMTNETGQKDVFGLVGNLKNTWGAHSNRWQRAGLTAGLAGFEACRV